jgi:hypothetical protein
VRSQPRQESNLHTVQLNEVAPTLTTPIRVYVISEKTGRRVPSRANPP